jgi:hypothetical protein
VLIGRAQNGEYAMQQGQMGHQLQEQQPHLSEGGLYSYNQPPGPGSNYYPDQPQQFARQPVRPSSSPSQDRNPDPIYP